MAVVQRRRHQDRGLAAGIAEHDALVARAFILVAAGIDALGDVRRLGMQQDFDLGGLPVKTLLLVTDILDGGARRRFDFLGADRLGSTGLPRDDHAIGGGQGFAGRADVPGAHAFLGTFAEKQVHHFVGDTVADLVGVTFRHAFRGEKIVRPRHALFLWGLGGPSLQGIGGGSTAYAKFDISCALVGIHAPVNRCYRSLEVAPPVFAGSRASYDHLSPPARFARAGEAGLCRLRDI